ncbi:leucine-rich repeat-containing protein 74A-like isoform X2 [Ruditapes philippinarum]|uniref:leucine-rich repeat-containing protein 74A-like isoform X2 n=1 Tax=Ruditapes philippinarum TaxID=129788 RepID=UPI00295B6A89|nr:leucine-rich repeat-containing protein 74A-like isoform X2 [Ruditapes philippinarum]
MALSSKSKQKTSVTYSPIAEMDEGNLSRAGSLNGRSHIGSGKRNGMISPSRQVAMSDMKTTGLGSKQASLYLSRTASLVRTGRDSGPGTPNKDGSSVRDSDTNSVSKKTSVSSFEREFTFTGYDIMADTEPVKQPKESEDEKKERENVQCYISSCKQYGINPVNYIARHINDKHIVMKSHPIGPQGARALCVALVNNKFVEKLDLEDNDIGTEGAVYIAEMLQENDTITEVRISENMIGSRGAYAFTELLKEGKFLHTLDISGSGLEDSDSKFVADMIEFNSRLKVLNVSHNRLSSEGAFDIGRAIAINDTLQELDLSWNHIRGRGALAVAVGVQKNVGLKVLNLGWNGFAKEGAMCLGRALEENRTLLTLDISNNRIGMDGIGGFLKGLQQNDGLTELKIGQNPFSPEVALTILRAIEESDKCVIRLLDLSDIVVRSDFLEKWDEIKRKREIPLRIMFGAVVRSTDAPAKDPNALDWRDPVVRMFKYMQDQGYRVIDLLKRLDKDRSFSVDRQEFKLGLMAENIPLTEAQLDEVIDRLDTDGDGEVDLGELLKGEKDFRRKMHLRMRKMLRQTKPAGDSVAQKLLKIELL